ncbi:MAG TPA: 1-acyl-sn-glycerol-3-phosphate acyltransferase [Saprospiraceae bacterium]|nr:1-acyl-sn-glycerol-3-phosphate acyltransferase [Saprospiraceae bacterium]HRP85191.1 1-acyl-sn-glycerol-3-phosphate acyltransferase [Saprospiraceae bacterium]
MNIFYPVLKKVVRFTLRFFFKRIYINKFDNLPDNTPILIACNHNNAFADALFVGAYLSKLDMHFITRGDVFNPKMMWFFRLTNQVPIFRFRDGYENLKKNNNSMEFCYDALGRNQRIIIFSEGDCKTEKHLRPIQKGTARMAFGAYDATGQDKTLIYPVGINYIEPHSFRSSILISQGEPLRLIDYIPLYKENPHKAIKLLTDDLEFQLKKEVLHIEEKEAEKLAQTGFEILDNAYPGTLFSLAKNSQLFNRLKMWSIQVNKEAKDPDSSWLVDLKELKDILISSRIKTKWPFFNKSFPLNMLLFILLFPIGILAQGFFYPPILLSKWLTIRFKPRREFFLSIRIGISWAILTSWISIFFIIIGVEWSWRYGAAFVFLSPILAKIGLIWWNARNILIQKIRWSSLDDIEEERASVILEKLNLNRD